MFGDNKALHEWDNCVLLAGSDLSSITSDTTQEATDAECGDVYCNAGGSDGWVWRRYATGLTRSASGRMLDECIASGFLTPTLGLTTSGRAELNYAGRLVAAPNKVPSKGNNSYYPTQLRGPVDG
jgi:hypothetical protein